VTIQHKHRVSGKKKGKKRKRGKKKTVRKGIEKEA